MTPHDIEPGLVCLIDVDNTLIDNDRVKTDVDAKMKELVGEAVTTRFWELYELVRQQMDGVDIPSTLHRIEPEFEDKEFYRQLYRLWMDFPYRNYIYPGAFDAIQHIKGFAVPFILSDGDASFQLRKIVMSGLSKAVDGNVLIYLHKDHHFEDIALTFRAKHYVMIDDKPNLLAYAKDYYGNNMTTILVKQGKYAHVPASPAPDKIIAAVQDLASMHKDEFF
jgi:FMN phosphatase YigB (HAD superfamily)